MKDLDINYKDYSITTKIDEQRWRPPASDSVMLTVSEKLACSTRVFPEYLLAIFAYFDKLYGVKASSVSELLYMCVGELINNHALPLPDADTAIDFMLDAGWIKPGSGSHHRKIPSIRQKQTFLEKRISSGQATIKEQVAYWENIDPEKAEMIRQEEADKAADRFREMMADVENKKVVDNLPRKPETIATDHKGLASQVSLDNVKTTPPDHGDSEHGQS